MAEFPSGSEMEKLGHHKKPSHDSSPLAAAANILVLLKGEIIGQDSLISQIFFCELWINVLMLMLLVMFWVRKYRPNLRLVQSQLFLAWGQAGDHFWILPGNPTLSAARDSANPTGLLRNNNRLCKA